MEMWNSLTEARRQSGLSQQEVAEALDVSRQAVSRWETGAAAPSTENLVELARLYGATLDALMNGPAPVADAAANEAPHRKIQWGWITAAALALILAAVIAVWALYDRGERDGEIGIIDAEDMEEEVIPSFDDIDTEPWREWNEENH